MEVGWGLGFCFCPPARGGWIFLGSGRGAWIFLASGRGGAIYFIHRNIQTSDPQPVTSEFPKLSSFVGFARKL